MDLKDRIQLIDDLIAENPDHTIRDYLDTVAEIEQIDNPIIQEMPNPGLSDEQKDRIVELAAKLSYREVAQVMEIHHTTFYRILRERHFDLKAVREKQRLEKWEQEQKAMLQAEQKREQERLSRQLPPDPSPVVPLKPPPAEYSNRSPYGIATAFHQQNKAI